MSTMKDLNDSIAATYNIENRGVCQLFARYIIGVAPPITRTSIIHDNACGPAIVTSEILSTGSKTAAPSKIEATDLSPQMIKAAEEAVQAYNWKIVNATVQNSEKLSFENDTFSHSFTNFLVPRTPASSSEIHRTLKPGGTAIYTAWKLHGFIDIMKRCREAIPVKSVAMPSPPSPTKDSLTEEFLAAGFLKDDIEIHSHCVMFPFEDLNDLQNFADGPFGKFLTKSWSAEEVEQLPEAIGKVLTGGELERKSLEMEAWIVVAKKP